MKLALGLAVAFLVGAAVLRFLVRRMDGGAPAVVPGPAPMSLVTPPPRRAAGPALRIHLCVACATSLVPRAGDVCPTCLRSLNPVPRAEEITREAAQ